MKILGRVLIVVGVVWEILSIVAIVQRYSEVKLNMGVLYILTFALSLILIGLIPLGIGIFIERRERKKDEIVLAEFDN